MKIMFPGMEYLVWKRLCPVIKVGTTTALELSDSEKSNMSLPEL